MNQKSTKFSVLALFVLLLFAIIIYFSLNSLSNIGANPLDGEISASSIPFKQGDNLVIAPRSIDLSGRIIGLGGSLITIEEAKRRGVIEGVFNDKGNELTSVHLLSQGSSFIIRVKDISSSPALFF